MWSKIGEVKWGNNGEINQEAEDFGGYLWYEAEASATRNCEMICVAEVFRK
ncbi:MAG: hypothetical protein Kow0088_00230 [Anaerolineales bacterium]